MSGPPIRWLEIAFDYRCNNRCVGCFSVQDHGPAMDVRQATALLRLGRERGAAALWLGGGEPTMRPDLFAVVQRARSLGYERVKLQTNGMLLSYPTFAEKCAEAGVTEVSFSIKGAQVATHDHFTQTPGCFDLMRAGIGEARSAGLALEGDYLAYAGNVDEIAEAVATFRSEGLARFRIWLLSTWETSDPGVRAEIPRIRDVVREVIAARNAWPGGPDDRVVSLHTPPCTVPAEHAGARFYAPDLALWVADPGGDVFPLERSPIEGGTFLERCSDCTLRPRCGGLRPDYVARHGDAEFVPPAA